MIALICYFCRMKKVWIIIFFVSVSAVAQEKKNYLNSFDANYFYGSIMEHSSDIAHLITGHPEGVIMSWNRKTFGFKKWEARYNYPDYGASFIFQDLKNPYLGESYGLYGHMNFYFFNRNLMLRLGQGVAYNTNPYDPDENYYNNAYGSHLLSSTYLMANFKKENVFNGFGFQLGISLIHYSNADFKTPNNSTNTFTLNAGLNYIFNADEAPGYIPKQKNERYSEPIHVNFVIRSGVNSMGVIGTPAYPFLTFSVYADKRVNRKSILQAGTELFFSKAFEEFLDHEAIAYPVAGTSGYEDSRRVGLFIGHQLSFAKLSVITQLGYYAYYPYERYVPRVYNRIGLQYDFSKNFFGSITLRSHAANAEAVEFSLGYRL